MATGKFTIKISVFNQRRATYDDITADVQKAFAEGNMEKHARLMRGADSFFMNCLVADLDEAVKRLVDAQQKFGLEDLGEVERSVSKDGRRGSAILRRGGPSAESCGL